MEDKEIGKKVTFEYIGIIHTPFKKKHGMPIQAASDQATGTRGIITVFPKWRKGLKDLGGFSHAHVLYHFHLSGKCRLQVAPFLESTPRGIFSIRGPCRPNPIGLSVLQIEKVDERKGVIEVLDVDMVDGTPLLDIKPFIPHFDHRDVKAIGWLKDKVQHLPTVQSDDRMD